MILGVAVKNFMNAIYALNIMMQAIFGLLIPIGLAVFLGWLLTAKLSAPNWSFVVLILLGVASGLVSMIRFLISALAGLERLEKEQQDKK